MQPGGNCVVIGLGLIGQLTCQLLNASGVRSIGIDIEDTQVKAAIASGASFAWSRNQEGLEQLILGATNGYGTDAVIITAGTSSLIPWNSAGSSAVTKVK
ncbi:MAG: hypothetical protein IPJ37_17605 [Bacteroidales bacterium]|nr:hypothetical protein [Bacteroidales bacterium]